MIISSPGIRSCFKLSLLTTVLHFSPFFVVYGTNPHAPLGLAPIPDFNRVNTKAKDLIAQVQEIHKATVQHLQDFTAKYEASADKK